MLIRGLVVGVLVGALLAPAATVMAETNPAMLTADSGDAAVSTKAAGSGSGRAFDPQVADELVSRREEPFRPRDAEVKTAAAATIVQEYYDTCGDSAVGDLDRLFHLDDGATVVSWEWTTCVGGAFRGTEDELLLFAIDADLNAREFRDDFVIVQFMDGFYQVYRTFGLERLDDWALVDSGFGEVGRSSDGRTVGSFVVDAVAADLPLEYFFEVVTADGDGLLDELPNAEQFFPRFPTVCSLVYFSRAQLTVDPGQLPAVRRAIEDLGLTVTSEAPAVGSLTVEPVTDELLARLERLPGVIAADRPQPRYLQAVNDPEPTAWAIDQLQLEAAWDTVASHPVHVAVIDTGVDARRADLAGRVGAGYDGVMQRVIPPGANSALHEHGTAVAGVIGATRNNGLDVAGVNDGAVIRPVRLNSHDGCMSSESIVSALDAVVGMPEVRLVNMSFGGPASVVETAALDRAAEAGLIMVASTGNNGAQFPNRPLYPAAHPQVIGVGASTADGQVATYSQQGAVDLIAPGGSGAGSRATDIGVLGRFDTVDFMSGTSFSAPYVTGALSLWLATNPQATTAQARAALQAAAVDVSGTTADGAGILDVSRLLSSAETPRFSDTAGTAHEAAIMAIAQRGITGGFPDGTFRPTADVTRGQMATFLAASLDLEPGAAAAFPDVVGNTHERAIGALLESGITSGFPDGTFRPNDSVSRGQMATFLATGFALDASDILRFSDVAGTAHAANINALATAGIAGGFSDNTYRPANPVQRGQMATFLARSLDLIERATPPAEYVDPEPAPTPVVDPEPAPDLGSYTSVAAYEADAFETIDAILGINDEGLLDSMFAVFDLWNSYQISDAEFQELMTLWVEVLDTHIDHFAVRTPPATHAESFEHFTNGMDDFRVGGVLLGQCACDAAWDAFEDGLATWEDMFDTWPGSFNVASTPDGDSELFDQIAKLRELHERELAR